jgi:hypothetical protein
MEKPRPCLDAYFVSGTTVNKYGLNFLLEVALSQKVSIGFQFSYYWYTTNLILYEVQIFTNPYQKRLILYDTKYQSQYGLQTVIKTVHEVTTTQGVSWAVDTNVGDDFLSVCDQKLSYKHVSDFLRLRRYVGLKLRIKDQDYWKDMK